MAQVPVDAALGNQSVVVKNGNGDSTTAATVQVANVAPAFYFDASGGVFTKLDYSYVNANNAARPGDPGVRYWIRRLSPGAQALPRSAPETWRP